MGLSVPLLTAEDVVAVRGLAADLDRAAAADDHLAWVELDRAFHLRLMSRAPERMRGTIEALWNATHRHRRAYSVGRARLTVAMHEHALLVEAAACGVAEDAETVLHLHIRRTRRALTGSRAG